MLLILGVLHRIELPGGIRTPGWSEPAVDKLPHYGLPADMTGMGVLDIGDAEGFFSLEAERCGAAEVIGIENYPPMAHKFEICRAALGSRARIYTVNVYDLNPSSISLSYSELFIISLSYSSLAKDRFGMRWHAADVDRNLRQREQPANGRISPLCDKERTPENPRCDPTWFWFQNTACCVALLQHVGFQNVEQISKSASVGGVFRAAVHQKGAPPDEMKAPWS